MTVSPRSDHPLSPAQDPSDRLYLARAIELGRRGWGQVSPNPMVGCILVREDAVVGEGWHEVYGGPHAEVRALEVAGSKAYGATAYISLEPCRHEGKTPPCTKALLAAGVSRVVYGAADPGEDSGGGGAELAAAGIEVVGPLLTKAEAERENPGFFHQRVDRPWVELKLALSLDGRIAAVEGVRTLLSGEEGVAEVHRLRAGFDAILVGSRTAVVDDPALTVRGSVIPRVPPLRILLDSGGSLSAEGRLFREEGGEVWILSTEASPRAWRDEMTDVGAKVVVLPEVRDGRVDLGAALRYLAEAGVRTVLCEGGGVLGAALLTSGFVDRLHLLFAPRLLGAGGVPAFPLQTQEGGSRSWVPLEPPRLLGSDLWISFERGEG